MYSAGNPKISSSRWKVSKTAKLFWHQSPGYRVQGEKWTFHLTSISRVSNSRRKVNFSSDINLQRIEFKEKSELFIWHQSPEYRVQGEKWTFHLTSISSVSSSRWKVKITVIDLTAPSPAYRVPGEKWTYRSMSISSVSSSRRKVNFSSDINLQSI